MCRWVTSAALLLGLATMVISPVAAQNNNVKAAFLSELGEYLEKNTGSRGLSAKHLYIVKNVTEYLSVLDRWLNGVANDRAYISAKFGRPSEGYTQVKSAWQAARTNDERRYNGWVILWDAPGVLPLTLVHESVHVYHLAVGKIYDDEDKNGGPLGIERLAAVFFKFQIPDRWLKTLLKRIADDTRWTKEDEREVESQRKKIVDRIWLLNQEVRNDDLINKWAYRCLQNIGGRANFKGYRDAVNGMIFRAIQAKWRARRWELCRLGTGVYPRSGNKPTCLCAQANRRPQTRVERAALRWIIQPSDSKKCIRAR